PPYVLPSRGQNLADFLGFLFVFRDGRLWRDRPGFIRGRVDVGVLPEATVMAQDHPSTTSVTLLARLRHDPTDHRRPGASSSPLWAQDPPVVPPLAPPGGRRAGCCPGRAPEAPRPDGHLHL